MTQTDEFSYFTLGSGLPLDGAEATIIAAEFVFDNSYAAGACVARITYAMDEGEPQNQLYSCGKNWEPLERGTALGHSSGKRVPINNQSNYGKLIHAAFHTCEGHERALNSAQGRGLEPDSADLWVGMKFKLKSLTYQDQNGKDKSTIVPAEYLGFMGHAGDGAGAGNAKAAQTAQGAAKQGAGADLDPELVAQIKAVALKSEDFESFMEAAMGLDDVAGNKAAEKAVMSSKPGSLWATRND